MSGVIGCRPFEGNLDPIERQDLGRGQHIRATVLGDSSTSNDAEHVSVLLIVVAGIVRAGFLASPKSTGLGRPAPP
jgi:hypothetical protein